MSLNPKRETLSSSRGKVALSLEGRDLQESEKMGYVLVVSLPMVILLIMLSFGCFVMGRNKGRQEGRALAAQELGINPQSQGMVSVVDGVMVPPGTPPPPPPPHQHPAFPSVPSPHQPAFPSPTPHHPNTLYLKQQNGMIAA